MAVIPVWLGNAYFEADTGKHFEGVAESRSDIANFSTDWSVGSFLYCSADDSTWILCTSGSGKVWKEIGTQAEGTA